MLEIDHIPLEKAKEKENALSQLELEKRRKVEFSYRLFYLFFAIMKIHKLMSASLIVPSGGYAIHFTKLASARALSWNTFVDIINLGLEKHTVKVSRNNNVNIL